MISIIDITENAAKEIKKIRSEENRPKEENLRVSIVGGGCSGFSYHLEFGSKKEGDMIVSAHDVELLVDSKSALFLSGTQLDFTSGLNGKGFEFTNPNATRTCGCGSSFAV